MTLGFQRAVLRAVRALAIAVWFVPTAPAWAVDPFTVTGVPVDATAESAAAARANALDNGQSAAYRLVLQRMTVAGDWPRLPRVDAPTLLGLVQGFEIADERTSATRYIAKLTVAFKRDGLRALLRGNGVPFTESVSRPTLVLPVFDPGTGPVLWESPNPWREAWAKVNARDALAPLLLPSGDAADLGAVATADAIAGEASKLDPLARRYGAGSVLVAQATAASGALQVTLTRYGLDTTQSIVESFSGQVGSELLASAANAIATRFEEDWKRRTLIRFDAKSDLSATVLFANLAEWIQVRRRLERSPEVPSFEIGTLTRHDAQVVLHYFGEPSQLALALGQVDLTLTQRDGLWTLSVRPAADNAATTK
jgi:hypothetical protein